jgi:hypothetical protein
MGESVMLQYFASETVDATATLGDAGSYDANGKWVPVAGSTIDIKIIVPQPVAENELQMIEDGEHVRDYRVTWTESRIFVREGNTDSDAINYDGKSYKVMQVDDRNVLGNYYRIVMREID